MSVDAKLKKIVSNLSELTEIPTEEVEAEIRGHMNDGFSLLGALATWKSNHKFQLGLGTSMDFKARVIGKRGRSQAEWSGGSGEVANIDFMTFDGGVLEVKPATLWDDRIDVIFDKFQMNGVYSFTAYEKKGGGLVRIKPETIKSLTDDKLPRVEELEAYNIKLPPLAKIQEHAKTTNLFHGWVGRIINDKETNDPIGIEIADEESMPVTAWFGGRFSKVPEEITKTAKSIKPGDEVYVYGYVSINNTGDGTLNTRGLFRVGA